jgi:hypothetical protein
MRVGKNLQALAAFVLPHPEFAVLEPEVQYHQSDPLD